MLIARYGFDVMGVDKLWITMSSIGNLKIFTVLNVFKRWNAKRSCTSQLPLLIETIRRGPESLREATD
jgi:hypothetical protein